MNVKIIFLALILLGAASVFNSCYYENEEELYGNLNNDCDTANATYSAQIQKAVASYCISCHGSSYLTDGAGIKLDTYQSLKNNIESVLGAINHDSKYSPMPKNSNKLNDCILNRFRIWNENGMPEN